MKLLVERHGPVAIVTISRPEARNAIDAETAGLLKAAFEAFNADAELSVAVLTGAGETFCAGYDLKSVTQANIRELYEPEGVGMLGVSRMMLDKPVICAVEGFAVAGGLELAVWCDLRVASESAEFGVFCRRWGVPLIDGGTVRLPRLIGHSRALDMILTGRAVGAEEALSFGLANRIVPKGQALAEAERLAHEIARFPQLCLRTDRMSSYRQWSLSLEDALGAEGRAGAAPLFAEAEAGAARFAGGRGRGGSFDDI
jgi:enoyl-CoA hydratase